MQEEWYYDMLIQICNIQRVKERAVSKGYTKEVLLAKKENFKERIERGADERRPFQEEKSMARHSMM